MKEKIEKILVKILPQFITNIIGILYGYMIAPKKSYSQYGEDILLSNFFEHRGINKGLYVDIGAYHPRFISNTYLLHKKGWEGLCIDLDEDKLKWFRIIRGNRVNTICAGITGDTSNEKDNLITFYKHKRLLSEIDTLDETTAINNYKIRGWEYTKKQIKKIDINSLLDQTKGKKINFLNIDVEGVDEEILINLDYSKYSPTVIVFEDNNNFGGSEKIKDKLNHNGYAQLFISGGSIAYYLKSSVK